MKLKKDDTILVVRGKDKGKNGKIEKVLVKEAKVLVAGINLYKRHVKKTSGQKSEIKEINKPLHIGSVVLVCPKCKLATRVGFKIQDGKKTRICKKCEQGV